MAESDITAALDTIPRCQYLNKVSSIGHPVRRRRNRAPGSVGGRNAGISILRCSRSFSVPCARIGPSLVYGGSVHSPPRGLPGPYWLSSLAQPRIPALRSYRLYTARL